MSFASFCPALEELISSQRAVGRTGRVFEGLSGVSTRNNLRVIHQLMLEMHPERTLEIGLCMGGSALAFCASHRELGKAPDRQHVALDPFQTSSTCWDSCGLIAIERAELADYLDFRQIFSSLALPALLANGDRFGIIYVDGSHLFEDVFIDAYFGIRLLAENGIIAFDDSTDPHVAKVLRFLRANLVGSGLREIDLSKYNNRGLRYRAARLLGKIQLTAFRRVGKVDREWDAPFRSF